MRLASLSLLLLAAWVLPARAESQPYYATVADLEVLVRAGPSDKFPETGTLKKGAQVLVDHEEAGWLAIQAPQGSVSWVPIAFVDFNTTRPIPQNVMVSEDVTLAAGRVGLPQPLTEIRKAKAPAGSSLLVIGQKVTFANKQWYPVQPLFGDFRYVPKSSVRAGRAANTAFVVREAAPPGLPPASSLAPRPAATGSGAPPSTSTSPVNHPLWLQAEAAERDGRPADAEKLYFQLARLMNEPGGDHDIANLCYTRIHALREKKRAANIPPTVIPSSRVVRTDVPTLSTGSTVPAAKTARPTLLPPIKNEPVSINAPASATSNPSSPSNPSIPGGWTGIGRLVSTPLALDGRQTYALETAPGITTLYVVEGAGVKLRPFLNHQVKVNGLTHTHPNARKPYIVATDIVEAK